MAEGNGKVAAKGGRKFDELFDKDGVVAAQKVLTERDTKRSLSAAYDVELGRQLDAEKALAGARKRLSDGKDYQVSVVINARMDMESATLNARLIAEDYRELFGEEIPQGA